MTRARHRSSGCTLAHAATAWLAACDDRSTLPHVSFGVALTLVGIASPVLPGQADGLPLLVAGLAGRHTDVVAAAGPPR